MWAWDNKPVAKTLAAFHEQLGPALIGAEILCRVAGARATGTISWNTGGSEAQLLFKDGRPEMATYNQGHSVRDRQVVVGYVRGFAILLEGQCRFELAKAETLAGQPSVGIDTLGEVLVATLVDLTPQHIDAIWRERAGYEVEASAKFDRLNAILKQQGAVAVRKPVPGSTLGSVTATANAPTLRAWTSLLCLGGLNILGKPPAIEASPKRRRTTRDVHKPKKSITAPQPIERAFVKPPMDPDVRALHFEIDKAHAKIDGKNHYEVLGVAPSASTDSIRDAYFGQAKRWHSDRVGHAGLNPIMVERAADLFRAADEAHRILSNESERKTYDYILDRKVRGLPTDPMTIMKAEGLFARGQKAVNSGHAAPAEPLLREAVELNPGEAEFWVYWGYALYSDQGAAVLEEARQHISKGLKLNEKLDSAYEFLGRIARVEGDRTAAAKHLRKAIQMNPRNVNAQRELRLIEMRRSGEKEVQGKKAGPFGLGGLLDKVLRR